MKLGSVCCCRVSVSAAVGDSWCITRVELERQRAMEGEEEEREKERIEGASSPHL